MPETTLSLVHFGSTSIRPAEVVAVQAADVRGYQGGVNSVTTTKRTLIVFRGGGQVVVGVGYVEVLEALGWKERSSKRGSANG